MRNQAVVHIKDVGATHLDYEHYAVLVEALNFAVVSVDKEIMEYKAKLGGSWRFALQITRLEAMKERYINILCTFDV